MRRFGKLLRYAFQYIPISNIVIQVVIHSFIPRKLLCWLLFDFAYAIIEF